MVVCVFERDNRASRVRSRERRERERENRERRREKAKQEKERVFFVACRGGEDITVAKKKERKKKKKDFKRTLFLSLPCAFCSVLV